MKSRTLAFAAGILGALFLSGCQLELSPTGGGTGAEGLSGSLVDPHGAPVSGARIWLYPDTSVGLAKSSLPLSLLLGKPDSTLTSSAGHYSFKGLPPGRYSLSILYERNDSTFAIHQSGVVVRGDLQRPADTLRLAGTLFVYARDAAAKALPGAKCEILGSPWHAVSNAAGNCVFRNIGAGDMLVKVTSPGRSAEPSPAIVLPGDSSAACQVFLYQPDQEGWIPMNEQGVDFWIPPTLVFKGRSGEGASGMALYQQDGLELSIRNAASIDLLTAHDYPDYQQDTAASDTGEKLVVESWQYPIPTDSVNYGARILVSDWVFLLRARTAADRDAAVRILRTVRRGS